MSDRLFYLCVSALIASVVLMAYCGGASATCTEIYSDSVYVPPSDTHFHYNISIPTTLVVGSSMDINGLFLPDHELLHTLKRVTVEFDSALVTSYPEDEFGYPLSQCYVESTVASGACTVLHGYTMSGTGDTIFYDVIITSVDHDIADGRNDDKSLLIDDKVPSFSVADLVRTNTLAYLGTQMEANQAGIGVYSATYGIVVGYSELYDYGDIDHEYTLVDVYTMVNDYTFYDCEDFYKLNIQRDYGEATDPSKWHVWDSEHTYVNESGYCTTNLTLPLFSSCCDWVTLECEDMDTDVHTVYFVDFCDEFGPAFFNLSGYTRSVYGNLVPGVLLSAQGETEYSDNVSFYDFVGLETGSFTLHANKTGYYNSTDNLVIASSGDYQHDVYMIPLDALDTGEFGGLVYDRCSLDVIDNARVYLYNVTSGEELYVYSNDNGFFTFPGLAVDSSYKVRASAEGYEESVVYEFVYNESNVNETHCKTKNVWLLPEGGCDYDTGGVPTPSPTPTPTPTSETPIIDLFDMLGLGEYMNFILALLVILFCGGSFGRIGKGNEMAILVGAFFGFIVDVALGWLPRWLLALVIIVVVAFLAFQLKK